MKPADLKIFLALCGYAGELPEWLDREDMEIKISPVVAAVEREGKPCIKIDLDVTRKIDL